MHPILTYLLFASLNGAVFYCVYRFFFSKKTAPVYLRIFLLGSILLSLLLPLLRFNVDFAVGIPQEKLTEQATMEDAIILEQTTEEIVSEKVIRTIHWSGIFIRIYLLVAFLLLVRFLWNLVQLFRLYLHGKKFSSGNLTLINHPDIQNSFSFFRFVFLPEKMLDEEREKIIVHEKAHARQYHSADILLFELVSICLWFNPFIWLLKESLQQVHEFLADKGVVASGIDRRQYQALLLNQVAESNLISFSSGFNYSFIKNRIAMMTTQNFSPKSKFKFLVFIPLSLVLILFISCTTEVDKDDIVAAVAPVRMNVLYIGVENPINVAVSGYDPEDLDVEITNGTIEGENGNYVVRARRPGNAFIVVSKEGEVIKKTEFRVKVVPDPKPAIAGRFGGEITKFELLEQDGISAEMRNFDFDLSFQVTGFTLRTTQHGFVKEGSSKSNQFTSEQKSILQNSKSGQRIYFDDITCVGPDGVQRKMPTLALKVL